MRWRTVRRVTAVVSMGLAAPLAIGAVGMAGATGEIYPVARRPRAARPVQPGDDEVSGVVALVAHLDQAHVEAIGTLAIGGRPPRPSACPACSRRAARRCADVA